MKQMRTQLIGIAGAAGAGKDVVADMLCRLYDAENLSTGDFVRAITRFIYRLPADFNPVRDQLYEVATYIRTEINPATTIKMCMLQAKALNVRHALLTGLRSTGEADAIRAGGGIVIGVDADTRIRYNRIYTRQRDSEARKSYDEFLLQDDHENKGIARTGGLRGIRAIITEADIVLDNNGSMEALEEQVRTKLGSIFIS
jgi:dephospho-CoA kinase